nr:SCO family protein [Bacillus fonticola]
MNSLWTMLSSLLVIVLAGCGTASGDSGPPPFEAIDQNGDPVTEADYEGKTLLVDFIFTSCETVCPPMTFRMAKVQQMLEEKGLQNQVELISFSIDPQIDTPENLKEFIGRFTQDESNWTLLTGYSQSFIENYAVDEFGVLVKKPANDDQVIHGTSFILISPSGDIVDDYSGVMDTPYDEILEDIQSI